MKVKYDVAEAERLIAEARRCKWCKGTGRSGPEGCFACLYCEGSKTQPSAMADQLAAARAEIARMRPVYEASLDMRAADRGDAIRDDMSIAEAEAIAAENRSGRALMRWRNAVDAVLPPPNKEPTP